MMTVDERKVKKDAGTSRPFVQVGVSHRGTMLAIRQCFGNYCKLLK
jgi:hypothetical protein